MAQPSNRGKLLDATLRCFDRLPLDRITVRAIAAEAGANPASIIYHFGSRDALLSAAAVEGLDRWLVELASELGSISGDDTAGADAAGLLLAMFHGMLVQTMLDDRLAIDGARLEAGLARMTATATGGG